MGRAAREEALEEVAAASGVALAAASAEAALGAAAEGRRLGSRAAAALTASSAFGATGGGAGTSTATCDCAAADRSEGAVAAGSSWMKPRNKKMSTIPTRSPKLPHNTTRGVLFIGTASDVGVRSTGSNGGGASEAVFMGNVFFFRVLSFGASGALLLVSASSAAFVAGGGSVSLKYSCPRRGNLT